MTALRMPDWVVLVAAVLAGFTWQLRLLPVLLMLVVVDPGTDRGATVPGRAPAAGVDHSGRTDRWWVCWS